MTRAATSFAAVLVSHGDRGGAAPNAALRAQAEAVRALTGFRIAVGMLKGEPTIEQGVTEAAATGIERIAVYPLFMADGYFVDKVRERVAAAGVAPQPEILSPLGLDPALPDILVEDAATMASREGIRTSEIAPARRRTRLEARPRFRKRNAQGRGPRRPRPSLRKCHDGIPRRGSFHR